MQPSLEHRLNFTVEAEAPGSKARACRYQTLHNEVLTPVFMPVATFAAFRSQDTQHVASAGFPVILANTYHLLLRPGPEVFEKAGGIHRFMNWGHSVLTDSGGFQIFSMSDDIKITEEGAVFKSYLDGKKIMLSPEKSIAVQRSIGSDIMMVLDQCIPSTSDRKAAEAAADITARWAERSLAARGDSPQSLFGIVQGACDIQLRRRSASQITSLPFDGYAIGGLAVGESEDERKDITELAASLLPRNYPRYLMGVGTPIDLLEAVHRGVDMFDCILPAAFGQQGTVFTSTGRVELRRGVYKFSDRPLDENCSCPACTRYTKGYLHHLIKCGEFFGMEMCGLHNLHFYKKLMADMRTHILDGSFHPWYLHMRDELVRIDEEFPHEHPQKKIRPVTTVLGNYEIIRQDAGFYSIRQTGSGEVMHSVTDPMTEAKTLYTDQAALPHELCLQNDNPFVIWDVGLGAATNAMSTVFAFEQLRKTRILSRKLVIISFENDLDSLRLAVKHPSYFPQVHHAGPASILKNGRWISPDSMCEWILLEGDFTRRMDDAPAPDCMYYDPFSLHTDTPLWSEAVFSRIKSRCGKQTRLYTYSASTKVRGALLAAGFFVGKGPAAGPKADTTAAYAGRPDHAPHHPLLGQDWFARWNRSEDRYTAGLTDDEKRVIDAKIAAHPQFAE